jgi:hypothetical protein
MRLPFYAAALLIAPLGACGSEETSDASASTATGSATSAAVAGAPSAEPPAPGATPMMAPVQASDTCGADKLGRWLNVLPTEEVKSQIAATVGDRAIRYYTQGDMITMDFSEDRLNVELGADGRTKLFRCG